MRCSNDIMIARWTKMIAFELKSWEICIRESCWKPCVREMPENKEKVQDLKSTFCTHRITNSEKVWKNYSNCWGICNYYKSSQPTKAVLSTLHEVHWKLWEQKWNHIWAHFAHCIIIKGRSYSGVFKVIVKINNTGITFLCFYINTWIQKLSLGKKIFALLSNY